MTQRVLVLGGSGYVGRNVARVLVASGAGQVVAAARRPRPGQPGVEALALDATDAGALESALRHVDWVVNCVSGDGPTLLASARALARAAARARRQSGIVHLSSMAVYGPVEGVVDEHSPLVGGPGAYAAAKLQSELALAGLPRCVILRPGCIYGRGSPQWSLRIARLLRSGRIGDLGAAGQGRCNLVHVDDVASAVVAAIATPATQGAAFNLAMRDPPTWNGYFDLFARALGIVPARVPGHRLAVEAGVVAPLLVAARTLASWTGFGGARIPCPIPASLLRLWRQDIVLDPGKAEHVLRLAWTPLERGVSARHQ